MRKSKATTAWFTLANDADATTVAAAYRASLVAQRHRLGHISIDVLSVGPWPAETESAVAELQSRLIPRKNRLLPWVTRDPGVTVDLDPRNDADFALALAIAPFTIGGTGLSTEAEIIWDGSDTGTSGAFQLTDAELEQVMAAISDAGGSPAHLVPLPDRRGRPS